MHIGIVSSLLAIAILVGLSSSKVIQNSIPYNKFKKGQNSAYITKFSYDIGNGDYNGRVKFNKPLIQANRDDNTTLVLALIVDDRWEEY